MTPIEKEIYGTVNGNYCNELHIAVIQYFKFPIKAIFVLFPL